jgi:hypothetical protein
VCSPEPRRAGYNIQLEVKVPIYAHNLFSLAMLICIIFAHMGNNKLTESWLNTTKQR